MTDRQTDLQTDAAPPEAGVFPAGRAAPPRPGAGPPVGSLDPTPISIHEQKERDACQHRVYEQFSKRLGRLSRARARSSDLVDWLTDSDDPDRLKLAASLDACGGRLVFHEYFTRPELLLRLRAGIFCQKWRMCQVCAIRRSARLLRCYAPKLAALVDRESVVPYLVTLTGRSGDDLAERFGTLTGALRWIAKRVNDSQAGRLRSHEAFAVFLGSVFSVEIKRGEGTRGGGWHAHLHGVCLASHHLSEAEQVAVRESWCVAHPQADVRAQDVRLLRSLEPVDDDPVAEDQVTDVAGDLVEVFKYPMKFGNLPPADRYAAACLLKGRHMLRPTGILRGVHVPESYLDAPLDDDDLPYLRHVFAWGGSGYRQVERQRVENLIDEASITG